MLSWLGIDQNEDFDASARGWFRITLIAAALTVIFFVAAGFSVVAQGDIETAQKLAQAFAPFFVAAGAVVTFCGAVWRGKLGSEQTRQQKRQNDAQDEETLAKLVQDGAKLVSEEGRANALAGVATLQAVFSRSRHKYGSSAMDILSFKLESECHDPKPDTERMLSMIHDALSNGLRAGYFSYRNVTLVPLKLDHIGFPGLHNVTYKNGTFDMINYVDIENCFTTIFEGVLLEGCPIASKHEFRRCRFIECSFTRVSKRHVKDATFEQCDFTKATIDTDIFEDMAATSALLSGGNNFQPEMLKKLMAVEPEEMLLPSQLD